LFRHVGGIEWRRRRVVGELKESAMLRISRRRVLASAGAIAVERLLVPARAKAALEASGRLNLREYPGGVAAAIATGQPLFAPPGVYELPSRFALKQPLDLLGDASEPPTFRWTRRDAFIPGPAPVTFRHCRFADGPGYLVNMDDTAVEVPYIGVIDCAFEGVGGVIGWPTLEPLPGSRLRRFEVRRVSAKNVGRGIMVQGGTTVRFDVEDYACDGYTRFGLLIGPSGPRGGAYQADMLSGVVRRTRILNGRLKAKASSNNNGVYIAGRNVELDDLHIEGLGDGRDHDTEGLYTKVVHLRGSNVRLVNAGGNQALFGCKGGDPKKPNTVLGSDTLFENLEIVCTGEHQGAGVWFQAYEEGVFAKVRTVGLTGPALRMHETAEGPVILREWRDVGGRRNKASIFRLRGAKTVELIDCSVTPPYAKVVDDDRGAVAVLERNNDW
jgi:hypothetical protein